MQKPWLHTRANGKTENSTGLDMRNVLMELHIRVSTREASKKELASSSGLTALRIKANGSRTRYGATVLIPGLTGGSTADSPIMEFCKGWVAMCGQTVVLTKVSTTKT